MKISNWAGSGRIESVRLAGGEALAHTQVERLVSAMAAFDPDSFAGDALPSDAREELAPTIAAAWQAA